MQSTEMSGPHPESSDKRQLGSLAREAEQLRLKQSQADASGSTLLPATTIQPAVVQAADTVAAPVAAVEETKPAVGGTFSNAARGPLPLFPFGPLLVIVLMLLAMVGDAVGDMRTNALGAVVDMVGLNNNPELYVQSHIDRILATSKNDKAAMISKYDALTTEVKNKFGAQNQLTCYVQLSLAYELLRIGDEAGGSKIWRSQMKYLGGPQLHPPSQITKLLINLAENYKTTDRNAARELYLTAVRFYPLAPTSNTLSNIEQDLAELDQDMGNMQEANEYFKRAFALTHTWGNAAYNLYRLRSIVYTDIQLKQYADAIKYAKQAIDMASAIEPGGVAEDQNTLRWLQYKLENKK